MTFTDAMKVELAKPLDRKHVKPPAPGKHGEYIEGWRVIDEANRIFGFDGWTRETIHLEETNRELLTLKGNNGDYQQWRVGYIAKVRIVAGDVTREGTGFGSGASKPENLSDAIESAAKEAETDAMKRALMTFGNPFGLALYDKSKANVADVPESPAPTITEDQRDIISTTAAAAGVTLKAICDRYGIENVLQLTADAYAEVIQSLGLTIEKKKHKEAA